MYAYNNGAHILYTHNYLGGISMSINHGANLYDLSDKYGFSKEDFMDFSSNINPFGRSTRA